MKRKCLSAILCLLLFITTGASADLASLDEALSPLVEGRGTVSVSMAMHVKSLMPFDDTRIDLFNRVLKHAAFHAQFASDADTRTTGFQLLLGETPLMEISEQYQNEAYLLQTSLLQNRMLFSTQASPMDTLLAAFDTEQPAQEETAFHVSDVENAFDMLKAVKELDGYYRTLIDQTVPLTKKNTPNYTIEKIGKGRISYVAKLTSDQSTEMLDELHTLLSFGMDEAYARELSQVTFAGGLVVALYQNENAEDICVYIKGTMIYPDGDKRSLKWQWAFTPDRSVQTFTFEAARENGARDSRVIDAVLTRNEKGGAYDWAMKTAVNLRRAGLNETSTLTLDLQGNQGDTPACAGSITRVTGATDGGKKLGESETDITVDLLLPTGDNGPEVSGTASYRSVQDGTVYTELGFTFTPASATAAAAVLQAEETSSPVVGSIIAADPDQAQQDAQTPTTVAEEIQAQSAFLVGSAPLGLCDYAIPAEMVTINLDTSERKVHQSLMSEAAQMLAGNLIAAILELPAQDRALLSDGMTEADYAVFLAMLQ